MNAALEIKGLVKRYGKHRALNGLDLTVPKGSIFGLVGSNGAGKTTVLCAVAGLLQTHGGTVDILGRGPFHPHKHAGRISLLPQDAALPPHARVEEVLHYYARLQGIPRDRCEAQVNEMIEWVHLTERKRSKIRALSHGMRRRVTIAQAFLGDPELILLDEPLNGLDPREVVRVRELISERQGRQTIVISSHLLNEVEAGCDHVAFVEKGRTIRQDELRDITQSHLVVQVVLETAELDPDKLRSEVTQAELTFDPDTRILSAESLRDGESTAALNARLLRALLAIEVGILEIRRGKDLEAEYLKSGVASPPS